jgi:hypothetical protein
MPAGVNLQRLGAVEFLAQVAGDRPVSSFLTDRNLELLRHPVPA